MGKIYIGDLFSKKVTKRRPIWAKSLLWRLSILKGDPFGNTALYGGGLLIFCQCKTSGKIIVDVVF